MLRGQPKMMHIGSPNDRDASSFLESVPDLAAQYGFR
jgi:hypothetical protein